MTEFLQALDGPVRLRERDAVAALAVVEHVPESELLAWAETIARLLVPDGRLIITVPSPAVDTITGSTSTSVTAAPEASPCRPARSPTSTGSS